MPKTHTQLTAKLNQFCKSSHGCWVLKGGINSVKSAYYK